jgi:hypothetical protein
MTMFFAALLFWFATPRGQDPVVDDVKPHVVRIATVGEKQGSGFIVDRDGDRLIVVTAKHVVAQCDASARVEVYLAWERRPIAVAEPPRCSADFDVAVLAVPLSGAEPPERLRGIRQVDAIIAGTRVWAVGYPGTVVDTRQGGEVASVDRRSGEVLILGHLDPGFSGSPVLTLGGELVGMTVQAGSATRAFAIDAERLAIEVHALGHTVRLVPESAQIPNPAFSTRFAVGGQTEHQARLTLRQYVAAMNKSSRSATDVIELWPAVNRSDLRALFGDAVSINLKLSHCADLVPEQPPLGAVRAGAITCEQTLAIDRRTSAPPKASNASRSNGARPSAPPPAVVDGMTFHLFLAEGATLWQIARIEQGLIAR